MASHGHKECRARQGHSHRLKPLVRSCMLHRLGCFHESSMSFSFRLILQHSHLRFAKNPNKNPKIRRPGHSEPAHPNLYAFRLCSYLFNHLYLGDFNMFGWRVDLFYFSSAPILNKTMLVHPTFSLGFVPLFLFQAVVGPLWFPTVLQAVLLREWLRGLEAAT